jgi:hypothetical protein
MFRAGGEAAYDALGLHRPRHPVTCPHPPAWVKKGRKGREEGRAAGGAGELGWALAWERDRGHQIVHR